MEALVPTDDDPVLSGFLRAQDEELRALADASDVFVLRVRELIAVVRRHDAEEDRLFTLAIWHDTGGES